MTEDAHKTSDADTCPLCGAWGFLDSEAAAGDLVPISAAELKRLHAKVAALRAIVRAAVLLEAIRGRLPPDMLDDI